MKKLLILIGSVIIGQALTAGPVSQGQALEIGKRLLEGPETRASASEVDILWNGEFADDPKVVEPAFYVVGRREGGFVIVSANDNAQPVLAISETNRFSFENMPDHVRWWMERMKAYVRAQNTPTDVVRAEWASLAGTRAANITGTVTDRVEHLTPEWDQGQSDGDQFHRLVFNKFTPTIRQGNTYYWSYAGCVPVALAEVLTTLSGLYPDTMPSRGTGRVGGYTPESGSVAPSAYDLSTTYDWAGLRTLTGTAAIQQAGGNTALLDNLGHLIADCGAVIQANYNFYGTGAYVDNMLCRNMAEHLYISKTSYVPDYDDYTAANWIRMLKDDIAFRPIIYSGVTPPDANGQASGHAFVFDGYGVFNGTDVFHVNFGWGGNNNGYYYFDNLASDLGTYSYQGVVAVLDFFPDAQQVTTSPVRIKYVDFTTPDNTTNCFGITPLGTISAGQYLSIKMGGIKNVGNYSYSGTIDVYHEDRAGNRIGLSLLSLSCESRPIDPGHLTLSSDQPVYVSRVVFGDRLVGYFTNASGQEEEIQVEADGTIQGDIPLMPSAFIRTEASYSMGDVFRLRLKNYDKRYSGTTWTLTAPDGTVSTVPQSAGKIVLSQAGKYRIKAAVALTPGAPVTEQVVTYVAVQ